MKTEESRMKISLSGERFAGRGDNLRTQALSHPGDSDYSHSMRLHGAGLRPELLTLKQCFMWADPCRGPTRDGDAGEAC